MSTVTVARAAVDLSDIGSYTQMIPASSIHKCTDGSDCVKVEMLYTDSPLPVPINAPLSSALEFSRKLAAEAVGTALLLIVVVGSGITAQRLSPSDVGLQLLQNAMATYGGLLGIILMFGPVSGAHFNPCVSLVDWLHGDMSLYDMLFYTIVQIAGGIAGTIICNIQFDLHTSIASNNRDEPNFYLGEVIGTTTLLMVIHGCIRTGQKAAVPHAIAAWVAGGFYFTSSSIFANPAVTIARMYSDSFAGIAPASVGPYICFQLIGSILGYCLILFFFPKEHVIKKDDNLYLRICLKNADIC